MIVYLMGLTACLMHMNTILKLFNEIATFSLAVIWNLAGLVAGGSVMSIAAAIEWVRERKFPRHQIKKIFLLGLAGYLIAAFFTAWQEQYRSSQELKAENASLKKAASSVPVVEFFITPNKVLTIKNRGLVNVEDVKIFLTQYTLKAKVAGNHLSITGVDSFSKVGPGPIKEYSLIEHGKELTLDLTNMFPNKEFLPFFDLKASLSPSAKAHRMYYAFRMTFRNSMTKRKCIEYEITSALKGFSTMFENAENLSLGGPYDPPKRGVMNIKNLILEHQQAVLFGDKPSALCE